MLLPQLGPVPVPLQATQKVLERHLWLGHGHFCAHSCNTGLRAGTQGLL